MDEHKDDAADETADEAAGRPLDASAPNAAAVTALREMERDSEHLEETVGEARDAVQAAHRADTMASPGTEYGEESDGVVGGDADEPVEPVETAELIEPAESVEQG